MKTVSVQPSDPAAFPGRAQEAQIVYIILTFTVDLCCIVSKNGSNVILLFDVFKATSRSSRS